MFSYLKQVVDQVESQLDSILVANEQQNSKETIPVSVLPSVNENKSTSEKPVSGTSEIGTKLANKFETIKKQGQSGRKSAEFKSEPVRLQTVETNQPQSTEATIEINATVQMVQKSIEKTEMSLLELEKPCIDTQQGWGDGWEQDLEIPEVGGEEGINKQEVVESTVDIDTKQERVVLNTLEKEESTIDIDITEKDNQIHDKSKSEQVSNDIPVLTVETTAERKNETISESSEIAVSLKEGAISLPEETKVLPLKVKVEAPMPEVDSPKERSSDLDILKHREAQLAQSKAENAELNQQVQVLSTNLSLLQEILEQEQSKSTQLQKQFQSLKFDYDRLKGQSNAGGSTDQKVLDLTRALSDKEQSIVGLLQEGENLAKEILKANNTIKKYKKDMEQVKKELGDKTKQTETLQGKVQQLNSKIGSLQEAETYLQDQVKQLTDTKTQLTKKVTDLEMTVVKSSQEMTDLRGVIASLESEIQKMKDERVKEELEVQSAALEEQLALNASLTSQLSSAKQIASDLQTNVARLTDESQSTIAGLRSDFAQKEEAYRLQIERLEKKLHFAESKNEEIILNANDATAPLMQQIERLEAELRLSKTDWESQEMLLLKRCQVAEREQSDLRRLVSESTENEKGLNDKIKALDNELIGSRTKALELESKLQVFIVNQNWESSRQGDVEKIKELERLLLEKETRFEEQVSQLKIDNDKERERLKQEYEVRMDRKPSVSSIQNDSNQNSPLEQSPVGTTNDTGSSIKKTLPIFALSNLQTQLKQSKGQIQALEVQISMLNQTKDELTSQLVTLSQSYEELQSKVKDTDALKQEMDELDQKYLTVLELLGEKEERIMELEQDIVDMKEAFRVQITKQYK